MLELRIPPFSSTATFGHQHQSSLKCFVLRINQASDNNKALRNDDVVAYLPKQFILRHRTRPFPSLPEYVVYPAPPTASRHRVAYQKTYRLVSNGKAYQRSIEINQLNQTRASRRDCLPPLTDPLASPGAWAGKKKCLQDDNPLLQHTRLGACVQHN